MSPRRAGWWLRRSLRVRIALLTAAVTFACLLALALLAGRILGPLLISSVDEELRQVLVPATAAVRAGKLPAADPGVRLRVLDIAGSAVDGQPPSPLDQAAVRALKAGEPVRVDGPGPASRWLGSVVSTPDGSQRLVVAGAGLVGFDSTVTVGSALLLGAALAGVPVAAVFTWMLVGSTLRPVARMRRSVRRLPAGDRLPLPLAQDELRALAEDFNALLARQEQVSERLRRFTGDAAHELRSPVASIRVQAEVAVTNPDPELAQETLADVLAESERLSALLDGLLALARSEAGELPPAEPVELVTQVRSAIARLPGDAPEARVAGVAGQVWARAAHAEVELVLDNLLRNAARYAHGQIVVSVLALGAGARVVVDDDGPGIAPEHREKVLDRFYRVADDRARSSGGSGLGLALVAELLRRRGGQVQVGESPEGGARVTVHWPPSR